MKIFLTRIGFRSKVVVTGDVTQIDVPGGRSGLPGLEEVLGEVPGVAFVHLSRNDVVRARTVADLRSPPAEGAARAPPGARGCPGAAGSATAEAGVAADVFVADEQSAAVVDVARWA